MNWIKRLGSILTPGLHLWLSLGISLLTAILAFRSTELTVKTLQTFIAFYAILTLMAVLFNIRSKLTNPKTRQLLQFAYIMLGFVLMLTGAMGLFNDNWVMVSAFLLMLFIPGLALLRVGLHMNRNGDDILK